MLVLVQLLKYRTLLSSILGELTFLVFVLGLFRIRASSPVETTTESLFENFTNLGFFLNSSLSFLKSDEDQDFPRRLAIVIFILSAFIANS